MSGAWAARHDAIVKALKDPAVSRAIADLRLCRKTIGQKGDHSQDEDDNKATAASLQLEKQLDLALGILWSALGIPNGKDPNPFRSSALPAIKCIASSNLRIDDFKSIKTLQKSSGSFVEVVRCKLDRQLYVLKTIVKGFSKRNAAIQSPVYEARLLKRRRKKADVVAAVAGVVRGLTPVLYAAFQTQGSVHILMEYVPSGDFSEMLIAASKCGPEYPGRACTGLLTEDWIQRYAVDMVLAIGWVHSQGYVHRDIKPGNFLLYKNGHLKLCDFSSAAPFSWFHVAESVLEGRSVWARKVHNFYCTLPVGTCDYLSPELLEAEEERIALKQQQMFHSFQADMLPWSKPGETYTSKDEPEPGPYGPEMDWWSLGIMLYEMRYGVLPFFADQMQATYELIKDHETTLKFNPEVECSDPLKTLIRELLTVSVRRLGRTNSEEIHVHGFFEGIDWSQEWPTEPPFVPKSNEPVDPAAVGWEPELSTLHSPLAYGNLDDPAGSLSAVDTLPNFSALYSGDVEDFPAFVDSRDLDNFNSPGATSFSADREQEHQDSEKMAGNDSLQLPSALSVSLMPRSSSSPAIVDNYSSPSPYRPVMLDCSTSPKSAMRWMDFDLAFVGFSHLPDHDALKLVETTEPVRGTLSAAPSMPDLCSDPDGSPGLWKASVPIASTPYHRPIVSGNGSSNISDMPTPPPFTSTPAVALLHKQIVVAASRAAGPTGPHSFVTPARKPSWFGLPDSIQSNPGGDVDQTPAGMTPAVAVPQSPYPFPLASAPGTWRIDTRTAPLRRNDLARARSATPGAGSVGSDSRHSGGSNAMRDLSEREAWDEMMAAVQKSVRKKQREGTTPAPQRIQSSRPGIPHSLADPTLCPTKPAKTIDTPEVKRTRQRNNLALPTLATIAPSPESGSTLKAGPDTSQSEKPKRVARRQSSRPILRAPQPVVSFASPSASLEYDSVSDSEHHSPIGSRLRPEATHDSDFSDGSNPAREGSSGGGGGRGLRHKRSARQLLLKAQERITPTKPTRIQSPSLTEAYAAKLDGGRSFSPLLPSDASALSSSPHELQKENTPLNAAKARPITIMALSKHYHASNASTETLSSSGKGSTGGGSLGHVPVLGAIPINSFSQDSNGAVQPRDSIRGKRLRRKESREMLSEYRQGIGQANSMMAISSAELSPPADAFLDGDETQKTQRRFSSALPGGYGKFRKRMQSQTLQEDPEETPQADVSLMSGLGQRHSRLQGSLVGLEQRLAKLKARLEE